VGGGRGSRTTTARSISANSHVIGEGGVPAFDCEVDEVVLARIEPGALIRRAGLVESRDDELILAVEGSVVAVLERTSTTRRMKSCLKRGYSYTGWVEDTSHVRIGGALGN
jgi:hypothetical protein